MSHIRCMIKWDLILVSNVPEIAHYGILRLIGS